MKEYSANQLSQLLSLQQHLSQLEQHLLAVRPSQWA